MLREDRRMRKRGDGKPLTIRPQTSPLRQTRPILLCSRIDIETFPTVLRNQLEVIRAYLCIPELVIAAETAPLNDLCTIGG